MIISQNCILVERFREERKSYEEYVKQITQEKIHLAKIKTNERDIKILKLIYRLRFCTSSQIAKMVFKNQKHPQKLANSSIKKLFMLGCIDRFFPVVEKGSSQTHIVLAPIGARLIEIKGFRKVIALTQNWRHVISCNEIISEIFNKYKLIDSKTEIKIEFKNKILRPDLFAGWENNQKEYFSMFEIDLGTEHMNILTQKIKNYIEYFSTIDFKTDRWQPYENIAIIPEVNFVFNDEHRARKFEGYINRIDSNVKFKVCTFDNLVL
ncbi:hypothetical protein D3C87_77750 [compost metagenome]